jgi:SAM-dependent methyltransferase
MQMTIKTAGVSRGRHRPDNEQLLQEIAAFCRGRGIAESTFGRRAVNDGKFVARLRFGGGITTHTARRVRAFMTRESAASDRSGTPAARPPRPGAVSFGSATGGVPAMTLAHMPALDLPMPQPTEDGSPQTRFRFYDNRQKYLLFVNTCTEKQVVAQRIEMELQHLKPQAPAMRVFDAGVGDGTVLTRVMRSMHDRVPTVPYYIVGKEISLEDVRLALDRMPDRFHEHPATVLVMTNMHYAEAPWLRPNTLAAASGLVWQEVALKGTTAAEFDRQIVQLAPFLSANWTAKISPTTGNPLYERPVVLVLYREDHKLLLESVKPQQGAVRADFDLVIASQPYRARASTEFKASKVVAPLARALGPGGRLIGIHSHGADPGLEIIQRVWPGENPFKMDRHELLKATRQALGPEARGLNFSAYSDQRSIFRYEMHTLPSEVSSSIGTSTLLAAWNDAIYVAQIEDERLEQVMGDLRYLDATREILQKHGKLWFLNESYVVSRHRFAR